MTEEEANAIELGEEFRDSTKIEMPQPVVGRMVNSKITRRPINAYLILKRGFGKVHWIFKVGASNPLSGREPEQAPFATALDALEGLKRWRQANE